MNNGIRQKEWIESSGLSVTTAKRLIRAFQPRYRMIRIKGINARVKWFPASDAEHLTSFAKRIANGAIINQVLNDARITRQSLTVQTSKPPALPTESSTVSLYRGLVVHMETQISLLEEQLKASQKECTRLQNVLDQLLLSTDTLRKQLTFSSND